MTHLSFGHRCRQAESWLRCMNERMQGGRRPYSALTVLRLLSRLTSSLKPKSESPPSSVLVTEFRVFVFFSYSYICLPFSLPISHNLSPLSVSSALSLLCSSFLLTPGSILTLLSARAQTSLSRAVLFHRDQKQLVSFLPVFPTISLCLSACSIACLLVWLPVTQIPHFHCYQSATCFLTGSWLRESPGGHRWHYTYLTVYKGFILSVNSQNLAVNSHQHVRVSAHIQNLDALHRKHPRRLGHACLQDYLQCQLR